MTRHFRYFAQVMLLLWLSCGTALGTTYYVDPAGSNGNDGLSPQTPWRTLLKVGISTFQAGDVILFKRDGVWNEWLTPPSSGTTGNPIKFDAYGSGRPPEFTGVYATTASQWTNASGNVWQILLSGTQPISQLKFVRFGTIWGNAQGAQNLLANDRDWYYDSTLQSLYVWSSAGNPVTHYGAVTPIVLSGQSLIDINNVSSIEIQHIKLDWYDGYGIQIQKTSDHITLANIVADSQVPNGTVPIGFYVHPDGTPSDIHIYNTDAHRNYVGYRFDGTPAAIELKNCRGYANRVYGLVDNTGAVTYSYCHFYANNLATGISADVGGAPGPIDGGHNWPADTPPNLRGFMQYPARVTLTYDDPGLVDGSHQYLESILPMIQAKGAPLSVAVVTGYALSQQLATTFQSWINAGLDLNCHSVSHQYFVYPNAFAIQYTGAAASSVTLSIRNKQLTITAPGDPDAQVTWNLSSSATDMVPSGLDTLGGLIYTLNQRGVFSVAADPNMKSAVKSGDLADVSTQDIKSAPYMLQTDKTRLMTDEINWSMGWMNANLTGLPSNRVYVYPGSYEDSSTETIAIAAGFAGARGSGTMQPSPNAAAILATGIDVQNILSLGSVPTFQNISGAQMANKLKALVFKSAVWGVPVGIFWHMNELTAGQVSLMIDTLRSAGATLMTNTQLVNYLLGTAQNPNTTTYVDSSSGTVDVRPTGLSPVVDQGAVLSDEYKYDLMGIDQSQFGTRWEAGAFAYVTEQFGHAMSR